MKVVGLDAELMPLYLCCLEDWSDEMREAGTDRKTRWFSRMSPVGLKVKLAVDDSGEVGGMIQYLPIEHSFAEGHDMHFVNCIWVHGYREGRGDFQGHGMGKALLSAAEDDVKSMGSKALVAWGLSMPFWMRAKWFQRQGYVRVDKDGIRALVWKKFDQSAAPPKWIRQRKTPSAIPGVVSVTSFSSGWCQAQNLVCERARRVSAEFGDAVIFTEVDTSDRDVFLEWGLADALFVDGKEVRTGPPPRADKIRRIIQKRVRRLKR